MIRAVIRSEARVLTGVLAMVFLGSIAEGRGQNDQKGANGNGNGNGKNTDIETLTQVERTWVRALETADPALLETIVDDELSFIGPDGEYEDREAYLAGYRALPSLGVKVEKVEVDQMKVRVLGDAGVVTGHVLARVNMQGKTIVEDVRFTRVYQRRGARWRMVAGQGTRLASSPPARPRP